MWGRGRVLGVASVVAQGQASIQSPPPSLTQLAWLGTGSDHGNSGHSCLGELQNPGMGMAVWRLPQGAALSPYPTSQALSVSPLKVSLTLYP